jgi:hypothetical protein
VATRASPGAAWSASGTPIPAVPLDFALRRVARTQNAPPAFRVDSNGAFPAELDAFQFQTPTCDLRVSLRATHIAGITILYRCMSASSLLR